MRIGWFLIVILSPMILAACGSPQSFNAGAFSGDPGAAAPGSGPGDTGVIIAPIDPTIEDEVDAARWESPTKDNREWTVYAYQKLDEVAPDLTTTTPTDIDDFCPTYAGLSKSKQKNFWIYLLSSMAEFESGFDPNQNYTEDFLDSNGKRVVSRGLLQLSLESGLGYGCPLKKDTDLNDPKTNLDCGLRILNRWVKKDGVIRGGSTGAWRGGARYWAVLRNTTTYSQIKAWSKLRKNCH